MFLGYQTQYKKAQTQSHLVIQSIEARNLTRKARETRQTKAQEIKSNQWTQTCLIAKIQQDLTVKKKENKNQTKQFPRQPRNISPEYKNLTLRKDPLERKTMQETLKRIEIHFDLREKCTKITNEK